MISHGSVRMGFESHSVDEVQPPKVNIKIHTGEFGQQNEEFDLLTTEAKPRKAR